MEIVYTIDLKKPNDDVDLKHILTMDISCLNILVFSCSYLSFSNQLKYNPHLISSSLHQTAKSSFCVYICALEQPWYFNLISTSIVPIIQLVWSLDGTHLLVCNQTGICQIFQMKNGCINTMEKIYQYEIHEDILSAKYIFPRESIVVNLDRNESLFYGRINNQSSQLQYALHSGNFVCVTTSGTIHTLPINRSLSPCSYSLSQQETLCVSLCDIYSTEKGFNIILSERIQGALIQFFVVHYASLEPKLTYISCRARGFRIPSCYGKLQSIIYFSRHGIDCILTYMKSFSGDLIDLYEYNLEQEEWISITLLNSPQASITSISLSPNQFVMNDNDYQGLFGRQILIALSDGSIVCFDKLNLKCTMNSNDLIGNQSDFFIQIKHTYSGACCLGFTQNGILVLLRTITLHHISSLPSILDILVHLFEQYIVQLPSPCDIWDILCLISNTSIINSLIDRLVTNFEVQTLELKRIYFIHFKECLYHLHRLACPLTKDSCEHLTSLLIYYILLIVRDYLRLFIYEPTNRNFVDIAQEILQQTSFVQNIDIKRIKYLGDQSINIDYYQLISFTRLIDWITDLIFYLIGYFQLQGISQWLTCENLFTDSKQLQWLRELMIYCYILNKMNKISHCKISNLQLQQSAMNSNEKKEILKDIYHSLTKFSRRIDVQKSNIFDERILEEFAVLDIELIQSKADGMFPKFYQFLLPNSPLPQIFIRDHPPFTYGNSGIFDDFSDIQFDIITLGKISLSSNTTFRRCLRCSNYSRLYTTEPYPFLINRLNNRCVCGGLYLLYTH